MQPIINSFLIKSNKIRKDGTGLLYFRIKVGKEVKDISLKHHLNVCDWDKTKQRVMLRNPEAALINAKIETMRNLAIQNAADLRLTGQVVTANILKARVNGEKGKMGLMEMFFKHNQVIASRIGNDYTIATHAKYELTHKKVRQFLQATRNMDDITLQELKYVFMSDFENFLKAEQKLAHNSAMKHIKNLKKIVSLALKFCIINKNPFDGFTCKVKEVQRTCLTQQELDRLVSKSTLNVRLEIVRDVFVFCCYTGLSYADVAKLNASHVQALNDGFRTIIIPRTKTKVISRIPLLPAAEEIINRYHIHSIHDPKEKLLPVNSNQKMNEYLKEIATLCDIPKRLTVHLARHTFAT